MQFGCKKSGDDMRIDVRLDFNVRPSENIMPDGRHIDLSLRSNYDKCPQAQIITKENFQNNVIHLEIEEIENPDTCYSSHRKIGKVIHYGIIPNGTYDVKITLSGVIENNGSLTIDEDRIHFELDEEQGIQVDQKEVLRIPDNSLWGYVATNRADLSSPFVKLKTMLSTIATDRNLKEGVYSPFTVDDRGEVKVNVGNFNFSRGFCLEYHGDYSDIEAIMTDVRSQFPDDSFKLFGTNGLEY